MDYNYLRHLKQHSPVFQLLGADNAPLILSFCHHHFIKANRRTLPQGELSSLLDDYLHQLRERYDETLYPKSAKQYLDDWSSNSRLFLRKFYVDGSDEPQYDITPATEQVISWLGDLESREFIGTESRLLTVFQLLQEIAQQSEADPAARIAQLEAQKLDIDTQIQRIRDGQIDLMDPTQVRERFHQAEDTARKLLSDFRQVEHNFRELDRRTREQITTSQASKGSLLDDIFSSQDQIHDSDQGRSFRAFWEFLMSPRRQEELDQLLETLEQLPELGSTVSDSLLRRIKFFLLEAGEKVYRSNIQLAEQLRKFLDDRAWLENKRIMDIIHEIEQQAITLSENPPTPRDFAHIDALHPTIDLVMSRGLFQVPVNIELTIGTLLEGTAASDLSLLYEQEYIDEQELLAQIDRLLAKHGQTSLPQVIKRYPVHRGLAELVGYVNIATRESHHLIERDTQDVIAYQTSDGEHRQLKLPHIIYTRS